MNWLTPEGEELLQPPQDTYGFIYMIKYDDDTAYIGKKAFYSTKALPALKDGSQRPNSERVCRIVKRKKKYFDLKLWKHLSILGFLFLMVIIPLSLPYLEAKHSSAQFEHEATTSKISEDQLFYCMQRGMNEEEAVALIVNGFVRDVLQHLPMEFMAESQKLIGISLEGSVG